MVVQLHVLVILRLVMERLVGGRQTVLETDETSADCRLPIKSSVPLWLEELATYTGLVMDIVDLAKGFKGLADARVAVGDQSM